MTQTQVAGSNPPRPPAACQSVLEQDTEPQIPPDEHLAPRMAASAISVWMCV